MEHIFGHLAKRAGILDYSFMVTDLKARYSDKNRFYHTIEHIESSLAEFLQVQHLLRHPIELGIGICYHDSIQTNQAKNSDEKKSANFAARMLRNRNPSNLDIDLVKRLIQVTDHKTSTETIDEEFMADIDLHIFGQKSSKYAIYEEQIRMEYNHVSEDVFARKRSEVLRKFLDRESIYQTGFYRERYESQARKNLKKAIMALNLRRN